MFRVLQAILLLCVVFEHATCSRFTGQQRKAGRNTHIQQLSNPKHGSNKWLPQPSQAFRRIPLPSQANTQQGRVQPRQILPVIIPPKKIQQGQIRQGRIQPSQIQQGQIRQGRIQPSQVQQGQIRQGRIAPNRIQQGQLRQRRLPSSRIQQGQIRRGRIQPSRIQQTKQGQQQLGQTLRIRQQQSQGQRRPSGDRGLHLQSPVFNQRRVPALTSGSQIGLQSLQRPKQNVRILTEKSQMPIQDEMNNKGPWPNQRSRLRGQIGNQAVNGQHQRGIMPSTSLNQFQRHQQNQQQEKQKHQRGQQLQKHVIKQQQRQNNNLQRSFQRFPSRAAGSVVDFGGMKGKPPQDPVQIYLQTPTAQSITQPPLFNYPVNRILPSSLGRSFQNGQVPLPGNNKRNHRGPLQKELATGYESTRMPHWSSQQLQPSQMNTGQLSQNWKIRQENQQPFKPGKQHILGEQKQNEPQSQGTFKQTEQQIERYRQNPPVNVKQAPTHQMPITLRGQQLQHQPQQQQRQQHIMQQQYLQPLQQSKRPLEQRQSMLQQQQRPRQTFQQNQYQKENQKQQQNQQQQQQIESRQEQKEHQQEKQGHLGETFNPSPFRRGQRKGTFASIPLRSRTITDFNNGNPVTAPGNSGFVRTSERRFMQPGIQPGLMRNGQIMNAQQPQNKMYPNLQLPLNLMKPSGGNYLTRIKSSQFIAPQRPLEQQQQREIPQYWQHLKPKIQINPQQTLKLNVQQAGQQPLGQTQQQHMFINSPLQQGKLPQRQPNTPSQNTFQRQGLSKLSQQRQVASQQNIPFLGKRQQHFQQHMQPRNGQSLGDSSGQIPNKFIHFHQQPQIIANPSTVNPLYVPKTDAHQMTSEEQFQHEQLKMQNQQIANRIQKLSAEARPKLTRLPSSDVNQYQNISDVVKQQKQQNQMEQPKRIQQNNMKQQYHWPQQNLFMLSLTTAPAPGQHEPAVQQQRQLILQHPPGLQTLRHPHLADAFYLQQQNSFRNHQQRYHLFLNSQLQQHQQTSQPPKVDILKSQISDLKNQFNRVTQVPFYQRLPQHMGRESTVVTGNMMPNISALVNSDKQNVRVGEKKVNVGPNFFSRFGGVRLNNNKVIQTNSHHPAEESVKNALFSSAGPAVSNTGSTVLANTANALVNTATAGLVNTANAGLVNTANVGLVNTANIGLVHTANAGSVNTAHGGSADIADIGVLHTMSNTPQQNNIIFNTSSGTKTFTGNKGPTTVQNADLSQTRGSRTQLNRNVETVINPISSRDSGTFIGERGRLNTNNDLNLRNAGILQVRNTPDRSKVSAHFDHLKNRPNSRQLTLQSSETPLPLNERKPGFRNVENTSPTPVRNVFPLQDASTNINARHRPEQPHQTAIDRSNARIAAIRSEPLNIRDILTRLNITTSARDFNKPVIRESFHMPRANGNINFPSVTNVPRQNAGTRAPEQRNERISGNRDIFVARGMPHMTDPNLQLRPVQSNQRSSAVSSNNANDVVNTRLLNTESISKQLERLLAARRNDLLLSRSSQWQKPAPDTVSADLNRNGVTRTRADSFRTETMLSHPKKNGNSGIRENIRPLNRNAETSSIILNVRTGGVKNNDFSGTSNQIPSINNNGMTGSNLNAREYRENNQQPKLLNVLNTQQQQHQDSIINAVLRLINSNQRNQNLNQKKALLLNALGGRKGPRTIIIHTDSSGRNLLRHNQLGLLPQILNGRRNSLRQYSGQQGSVLSNSHVSGQMIPGFGSSPYDMMRRQQFPRQPKFDPVRPPPFGTPEFTAWFRRMDQLGIDTPFDMPDPPDPTPPPTPSSTSPSGITNAAATAGPTKPSSNQQGSSQVSSQSSPVQSELKQSASSTDSVVHKFSSLLIQSLASLGPDILKMNITDPAAIKQLTSMMALLAGVSQGSAAQVQKTNQQTPTSAPQTKQKSPTILFNPSPTGVHPSIINKQNMAYTQVINKPVRNKLPPLSPKLYTLQPEMVTTPDRHLVTRAAVKNVPADHQNQNSPFRRTRIRNINFGRWTRTSVGKTTVQTPINTTPSATTADYLSQNKAENIMLHIPTKQTEQNPRSPTVYHDANLSSDISKGPLFTADSTSQRHPGTINNQIPVTDKETQLRQMIKNLSLTPYELSVLVSVLRGGFNKDTGNKVSDVVSPPNSHVSDPAIISAPVDQTLAVAYTHFSSAAKKSRASLRENEMTSNNTSEINVPEMNNQQNSQQANSSNNNGFEPLYEASELLRGDQNQNNNERPRANTFSVSPSRGAAKPLPKPGQRHSSGLRLSSFMATKMNKLSSLAEEMTSNNAQMQDRISQPENNVNTKTSNTFIPNTGQIENNRNLAETKAINHPLSTNNTDSSNKLLNSNNGNTKSVQLNNNTSPSYPSKKIEHSTKIEAQMSNPRVSLTNIPTVTSSNVTTEPVNSNTSSSATQIENQPQVILNHPLALDLSSLTPFEMELLKANLPKELKSIVPGLVAETTTVVSAGHKNLPRMISDSQVKSVKELFLPNEKISSIAESHKINYGLDLSGFSNLEINMLKSALLGKDPNPKQASENAIHNSMHSEVLNSNTPLDKVNSFRVDTKTDNKVKAVSFEPNIVHSSNSIGLHPLDGNFLNMQYAYPDNSILSPFSKKELEILRSTLGGGSFGESISGKNSFPGNTHVLESAVSSPISLKSHLLSAKGSSPKAMAQDLRTLDLPLRKINYFQTGSLKQNATGSVGRNLISSAAGFAPDNKISLEKPSHKAGISSKNSIGKTSLLKNTITKGLSSNFYQSEGIHGIKQVSETEGVSGSEHDLSVNIENSVAGKYNGKSNIPDPKTGRVALHSPNTAVVSDYKVAVSSASTSNRINKGNVNVPAEHNVIAGPAAAVVTTTSSTTSSQKNDDLNLMDLNPSFLRNDFSQAEGTATITTQVSPTDNGAMTVLQYLKKMLEMPTIEGLKNFIAKHLFPNGQQEQSTTTTTSPQSTTTTDEPPEEEELEQNSTTLTSSEEYEYYD